MSTMYESGEYLKSTGDTWHAEDSPWKAEQIMRIMSRNAVHPTGIAEIGCGAGQILGELSNKSYLKGCTFEGFDISPQAIKLCERVNSRNCRFTCQDLLSADNSARRFDVLLAMDVFEHVPDYIGFIEKCRDKAEYKIYHIPLDIHVSSVLRNSFLSTRASIGHLHYFSADSAIATLEDTGHEIIDFFYTNGCFDLFRRHPSLKKAVANGPRWLASKFSVPLSARIFGGFSLLVLAK